MKEILKTLLAAALGSRKFVALIVALLASLATIPLVKFLGLPPEEAQKLALEVSTHLTALASAYLIGQGIADHGKEKARVEGAVAEAVAAAKAKAGA